MKKRRPTKSRLSFLIDECTLRATEPDEWLDDGMRNLLRKASSRISTYTSHTIRIGTLDVYILENTLTFFYEPRR